MFRDFKNNRSQSLFLLFVIIPLLNGSILGQSSLETLIQELKVVPPVYYTSEAYSYFTRSDQNLPPQPPREAAAKGYRALIKLGDMGSDASRAIPFLIESFPTMVHVTEVRNAQYAGEGMFEDWLMTYLTSEKNKFILSSPVLDYNSMSLCENSVISTHQVDFVDKRVGASGTIVRATVNITVTMQLYIGACTLTRITGASIGTQQQSWREWYQANGATTVNSVPSMDSTPRVYVPAVKSADDLLLNGTYKITLTTGDELTGVIEAKTDTSLILETTDGKPYIFRFSLIRSYELLKRPQASIRLQSDRVQLTYEELMNANVDNLYLEVIIAGGTSFKGTLASIDESMLRINVEGSKIPITKEAIRQIMVLPAKENVSVPENKKEIVQGPIDTVIIKNPQVDDWGVRGADLKITGQIQNQNDQSVIMKLLDGSTRVINRADIVRVFMNSSSKVEDPIKVYAKPLFCPTDMFLVDMPPGKKGKPFFKVCVDRYEYPNRKDQVPVVSVSFLDAKKYCESQGKRLCTAEEWEWACAGIEGNLYPYGFNREENKCNSDTRQIETSGARLNCVSKFGGYDMTGNVFEWVEGKNNEPSMMGGPYSKCQTVSPGLDGSAKPQTGLRCCKR
jgi:hypothetical protein